MTKLDKGTDAAHMVLNLFAQDPAEAAAYLEYVRGIICLYPPALSRSPLFL